jgi:hypothetical protein
MLQKLTISVRISLRAIKAANSKGSACTAEQTAWRFAAKDGIAVPAAGDFDKGGFIGTTANIYAPR